MVDDALEHLADSCVRIAMRATGWLGDDVVDDVQLEQVVGPELQGRQQLLAACRVVGSRLRASAPVTFLLPADFQI